ncbi:hypothetical protein HCN44_003479 [Aphidius gifuensis]|uniref:Tyr recombinase domain-containing protein n=1 Tax=Aphidius gifuensis TaxID=684658 RepID=A0A834XMV2_APHGI|nr:hypothetical protein HCN44_003479 [Aphidius gifuensis]
MKTHFESDSDSNQKVPLDIRQKASKKLEHIIPASDSDSDDDDIPHDVKQKASKIFQNLLPKDLAKFCANADDMNHLANKVILIVGTFGACRRTELHDITIDQVQDSGKELFISIPETKNDVARSFIIANDLYIICKKYLSLRPTKPTTAANLFLNYQKGKCTSQPIGVNKIGGVPAVVAKYLELPDTTAYTGHSFRRSGATLLADITTIMRFGGWKSQAVAATYIEDSKGNKRKIFKNMSSELTVHIGSIANKKSFIKASESVPSTSTNYQQQAPVEEPKVIQPTTVYDIPSFEDNEEMYTNYDKTSNETSKNDDDISQETTDNDD